MFPSNSFGSKFIITDAGESHGPGYVTIIEGCPSGIELSTEDFKKDLNRRRPGKSNYVSPRDEKDAPIILAGVFEGKTTGAPIAILVNNLNQNSKDYSHLEHTFRPGHADYSYHLKFAHRDHRGGGRSSARQTISRVLGAVIAKKILIQKNISLEVKAFVNQIGPVIFPEPFDIHEDIDQQINAPQSIAKEMKETILGARNKGDSLGSKVSVIIKNIPSGLGMPFYGSLKALLSYSIFSLPAVCAVEFGSGVNASSMKGSDHNDQMNSDNDQVSFESNNHGGILGGISTGENILINITLKPPSSISKKQMTINKNLQSVDLEVHGRHDPCLGPRFCPIVEAMMYIAIINCIDS